MHGAVGVAHEETVGDQVGEYTGIQLKLLVSSSICMQSTSSSPLSETQL